MATDVIPPETAKTLDGLFQERVRRSAGERAYVGFDEASGSWKLRAERSLPAVYART